MASPSLLGTVGTLDTQIVDLHLDVTTTTSGAVGTPAYKKGIASITRNGAGDYTITLNEGWNRLVGIVCPVVVASYTSTKGLDFYVKAKSFGTGAASTVRVQFVQVSGAAADVDDGAQLLFTIRVANSDV